MRCRGLLFASQSDDNEAMKALDVTLKEERKKLVSTRERMKYITARTTANDMDQRTITLITCMKKDSYSNLGIIELDDFTRFKGPY